MLHSRSPWMVGGYVGIHRATRGAARRRHTGTHSLTQGCRRRRGRIRRRCRRSFSLYRKSGFGRPRARRAADARTGAAAQAQTKPGRCPMSQPPPPAAVSLFIISRFYFMRRRPRKLRLSESGVSGQPGNHRTGDKSTRRVDSVSMVNVDPSFS